jgi:hypothetical protein
MLILDKGKNLGHSEERSDEAILDFIEKDCFATLAMTYTS